MQRAYIFVTRAPDDYEQRVRDEVPAANLKFVCRTTGDYEAWVVLDAANRDEIDRLVAAHLGSNPAGGQGVETTYSTQMGTRGLKNI